MISTGIMMLACLKVMLTKRGVCSLRVKANLVLCVKWIHDRNAGAKMVTAKILRNFAFWRSDENIGEAMEHEEKLCDEMETVRELTYIGKRVSADGGCEAAVTARARCGWARFSECAVYCYM